MRKQLTTIEAKHTNVSFSKATLGEDGGVSERKEAHKKKIIDPHNSFNFMGYLSFLDVLTLVLLVLFKKLKKRGFEVILLSSNTILRTGLGCIDD